MIEVRRRPLGLSLALALAACADPEATVDAGSFDRAEFEMVNPVLVAKCASLDCHGNAYRNYRLFGYGSLRLDPRQLPDDPNPVPEEIDANYEATLALEPEITARIADGEADAIGELTLVRKARGSEHHDGGTPLPPDGAGERCLVSWLAGRVDEDACAAARTE